ncbi:hypothetical protein PG997_009359 [Apiospora hydei]|uniref:Uncharacterized protein n=1 Tax=Apiospora hydei TaxID=1337664 RepID=A0ABR1VTV7_9PEZI
MLEPLEKGSHDKKLGDINILDVNEMPGYNADGCLMTLNYNSRRIRTTRAPRRSRLDFARGQGQESELQHQIHIAGAGRRLVGPLYGPPGEDDDGGGTRGQQAMDDRHLRCVNYKKSNGE